MVSPTGIEGGLGGLACAFVSGRSGAVRGRDCRRRRGAVMGKDSGGCRGESIAEGVSRRLQASIPRRTRAAARSLTTEEFSDNNESNRDTRLPQSLWLLLSIHR